ncbi:MAG TPA: transporter substrate-binding domain-containing protein [Burkholderiales bacterium]|jgi:polar amino acid transport system substrate-binding protein|nr:transporter substrate-binding domain-containing protein [Burkholderiales bacterium]
MIPRFATLALLCLCLGTPAARALTLVTEENPPFNYTEQGKVVGMSTEIVAELGKRSAIPLEIKSMPWEQAYIAAQRDKETCIYSTARLENRERLFTWIGPIATNQWVLLAKSDFAGSVKVVEDARKYRVGVVAKDAKIEFLMSKGVTDLREVGEDGLIPPRLGLARDDPDRLDLWATSAYGARRTAARANVKNLKLVLNLRRVPLYLACGRNTSPQTVRALSQAFERATKDGSLRRIAGQYAF